MNRPYVICHIFSSLDGKITGDFMKTKESQGAQSQYALVRNIHNCEAILYGTNTMLDFLEGYVGDLPQSQPIKREDYIVPSSNKHYVIAIDCEGKLKYEKNYLERHGIKNSIIAVLTNQVSDNYLLYLQNIGISYIFAGEKELDCASTMQKLKEKFAINKVLVAGGGYTDWSFGDAGMIDELSIILAPAADGGRHVSVFERNEKSKEKAITFTLLDVQKLSNDAVWLRYAFNNAIK